MAKQTAEQTQQDQEIRKFVGQDPMLAILAAELASQRGDLRAAAAAYTEAARQMKDPELAKRAVELSLTENDPERAFTAAKLWAELNPQDTQAERTILLLQLSTNRVDEAFPALATFFGNLQKLEAEHPGVSGAPPNKVALEMLLRIPDKAKAYQTGLKLFGDKPADPENQYLLSQLAFACEQSQQAIDHINKAIQAKPSEEYYIFLSQALEKRDDNPQAALALLEQQADLHPDWFSTRLYLARAYAQSNQWEKAKIRFAEMLQLQPNNIPLYSSQGFVLAKLADRQGAEKHFNVYLAKTPREDRQNETLIYLTLSGLALDEKDYEKAIKWLNTAPDSREDIDLQLRLATIYEAQGKDNAAQKVLNQFKAQNEDEGVRLTLSKAQLVERLKKPQKAVDLIEKGLTTYPDQPDLLYERAMVAERLQDLPGVERFLKRLIEVKPSNPHGYNALGYTWADRGIRLDEALQLIQKANTLAPEDPFILDSLGWIHYRLGQTEQAEAALQKAFALRPDEEIGVHLLEVLVQSGKQIEAKNLSEALNKRFPASTKLKPWTQRVKEFQL